MILAFLALAAAAPPAVGPAAPTCAQTVTPDALVCRALQAQAGGDAAGAAQAFERAAEAAPAADPAAARMWAAAGNLWIQADQPARAAAALDHALAGNLLAGQQRGEALLDRARAAEAQGDLRTARARATEAAAAVPDDPFVWYFSAALAIRENDPATAQGAIAKALALAPGDPTILFEAGHVAEFTGNDEQARSYWSRAAANDPKGEVGKAAARAIELLGVTPTVKSDGQAPR